MHNPPLILTVLPGGFALCQSDAGGEMPAAPRQTSFWTVARTEEELSLICEESAVPAGWTRVERGWCAIKVEGPLDFALVGILAKLAGALAAAGISVSAVSTFDTDYLFVKEDTLDAAIAALGKVATVKRADA